MVEDVSVCSLLACLVICTRAHGIDLSTFTLALETKAYRGVVATSFASMFGLRGAGGKAFGKYT